MNVRIPDADNTHRLGGTGEHSDLVPEVEGEDEPYEIIKHPKHYNLHPAGIECIDVIQWMTLNVGTAIKHLWRAGLKPGMNDVDDIKKAITYLEFELERLSLKPALEADLTVAGTVVGFTGDGKVTPVPGFF